MKDYNFFSEYQTKKGINIDAKSPLFIGSLVLIICVAICVGLIVRNAMLANQIESLNAEIQTIQSTQEYADAMILKDSIDSMAQYDQSAQAVLTQFQLSNVISTDLINTIASKLPSTVSITTFTMDNAGVNFTFSVPNRKAAAELLLSLKSTGLFLDVQLNSVGTTAEGAGSIASITAVMKAGEAK